MMTSFLAPVHREGWKFFFIFAFITYLLSLVSTTLGWMGFALTIWCLYFFRNPFRITPLQPGLVVSPADGRVIMITECHAPKELQSILGQERFVRISIFLNVFNVHVNRIPIEGKITYSIYHPGKFFNASLDKASEFNERQSLVIETPDNKKVGVVQIAGLIARRIVCEVNENDMVSTGQYYGLIRFGSRADVYLPLGTSPLVIEGQLTIAGETILADFNSQEGPREGIRH
jgi:phosphatidylserine decarboxylase